MTHQSLSPTAGNGEARQASQDDLPAITGTPASAQVLSASNILADLAARIRAEHEAVCTAARTTLAHAFAAGELLLAAKEHVAHGYWADWLHAHCDISERSAQKYMQLARHRTAFEANAPTTADLTIDEALRALAKPKPPVEIEADYFAVPSTDYLPTQDGVARIGIVEEPRCTEFLGVKADPRRPGYYHVAHMEIHVGEDGAASWCEPDGGRPVRADGVPLFLKHLMRRPDRFDDIEWHDHDRWPFPEPQPRWPSKEWIAQSRGGDDDASDAAGVRS
jgi:Protein of unknown function (DUF3102)